MTHRSSEAGAGFRIATIQRVFSIIRGDEDLGEELDERPGLVQRFSWAVPSDDALDVIARYAPIVEMGAGSGYWAHLMRERDALERANREKGKTGETRVVVVLRGDKDARYKEIYEVLQSCSKAGYRLLQLRVMTTAKKAA